MSRTYLKIDKCDYCGEEIIIDTHWSSDEEAICNKYSCFLKRTTIKEREGNYVIKDWRK